MADLWQQLRLTLRRRPAILLPTFFAGIAAYLLTRWLRSISYSLVLWLSSEHSVLGRTEHIGNGRTYLEASYLVIPFDWAFTILSFCLYLVALLTIEAFTTTRGSVPSIFRRGVSLALQRTRRLLMLAAVFLILRIAVSLVSLLLTVGMLQSLSIPLSESVTVSLILLVASLIAPRLVRFLRNSESPLSRLDARQASIFAVLGCVFYFALGLVLLRATDATFTRSLPTSYSYAATAISLFLTSLPLTCAAILLSLIAQRPHSTTLTPAPTPSHLPAAFPDAAPASPPQTALAPPPAP